LKIIRRDCLCRKGQIFSIDALLSFAIFLLIITLAFFVWNYTVTKINSMDQREEADTITYVLSQAIIKDYANNSVSSLFSINDAVCKKYGMYRSNMHCFVGLTFENQSEYHIGYATNSTDAYVATELRMIIVENKIILFKLGVISE
jgi:hypothetical protein